MKKYILLLLSFFLMGNIDARITNGRAEKYWFLSPNASGWLLFILDPITGRQGSLDKAFNEDDVATFEENFNPNDVGTKKYLIAEAIRHNRVRIFQIMATTKEGSEGEHLDVSAEYADYLERCDNAHEAFSVLHELVEVHGAQALEMLQVVDEHGISLLAQSAEGKTILHAMAMHEFTLGELSDPEKLTAFFGFLQDRLNNVVDNYGRTVLHEAIYTKADPTVVGLLLNHASTSIETPDNDGVTVEEYVRAERKRACNPDITRLEEQCYECNHWTEVQRLVDAHQDDHFDHIWREAIEKKRQEEERKRQELEEKLKQEQAEIEAELAELERKKEERLATLAEHEKEAESVKRRQQENLQNLEFLTKHRNGNN